MRFMRRLHGSESTLPEATTRPWLVKLASVDAPNGSVYSDHSGSQTPPRKSEENEAAGDAFWAFLVPERGEPMGMLRTLQQFARTL